MKILFTGGGTAGHIYPIAAITRELRRIYPQKKLKLFYLGPKDEFSGLLLSQEGIKTRSTSAGKIRRYFGIKSFFLNIIDILFRIPLGIIQAFWHVFFIAPDLIFSKGGYGSVGTVISGWILQVPIILHESDASPGLANRFLSKFAAEIFTSFSDKNVKYFVSQRVVLTGNPVRREILEGTPEKAKKLFNLSGNKPLILIIGGSQGSQRINDTILTLLPKILESFELIHQAGEKNFNKIRTEAKAVIPKNLENNYHLFPFLKENDIKEAYRAADLIISRAGSGSIFEIAALKKPCILIPLPEAAQNHQTKNAYAYVKNNAGIIIEEKNLTPHFFLGELDNLFHYPERLKAMSKEAGNFSKPAAAKIIAKYIVEYLKN
ncbi:UDP-N-acetylglucosamine--N-acetylmuramyl-(pentapeptide) pyrophosphoryl-undecaprenol N-acetylglucosamine transferase [Candidatus Parcubacteria bacterium]|nr:UDP-N-acetylglucosamine--N-acetylmuramyl-(pentapeptide) pyrophosphoryl-undecaprenol N-acetylglucosamine transferase [Candidatus Parcubacteria bacterium]